MAAFEPFALGGEAAAAARFDALAVLGLLRDPEDLLLEDPLRLLLEPFELREVVCRLPAERVLPWAMAPP